MIDADDRRALAQLAVRRQILRARRDPAEYAQAVGRLEGGRPIAMSEVHRGWHRTLSEHDRVVLYAPVGHGKSNSVTRWRVEWELGRNQNLRVGVVSSTMRLPGKILSAIKGDIERSRWLHAIFPRLRPATGSLRMWGSSSIRVERDDVLPDPSIQIFGAFGSILGSRLDLIILDDVCNLENTLSAHQRDHLADWVSGEVLSRLPRHGGRVWAVGHVWHEDDILARLARLSSFHVERHACIVEDEGGRRPLIPEMWTLDALDARARELGPIYSRLMLYNEYADATEGRIRRAWFATCLERGRGMRLLDRWSPSDAPTYTGVDLGVRGAGAKTVMFTVAVLPDGSRQIVDLRAGHWTGPQIIEQLVDVHTRYGSQIAVEDNAAQRFIVDFASSLSSIPIKGHTTGANKHHPQFGVESLGMELAAGKWIIPCDDELRPPPIVGEWISEAVAYSPEEHMGDHLSASWICREAIRASPTAGRLSPSFFDIDSLSR